MASLTVRQLDERLKKLLRLRAAKSGRSVEDEVRTILRAAAEEAGEDILESFTPPGKTTAPRRAASAPAGAKRVLLIVGGGIAAYKSLDLIRRLKERGLAVRCILTKAAEQFVTPLSAGAILGERVFTDLFDAASEFDVGHIRLARETDLIVVAPATADLMAKMAGGLASDLATAVLLAAGTKILLAPAMNPHMWANNATQRNLAQLVADGVSLVGPNEGEMAEAGERGLGRMAEPLEIAAAVDNLLDGGKQPLKGNSLKGLRVLVTSGPTHEPIDPVRYIANRSSGKQGHAIAAAAAAAGADVTLVSGPVNLPDPPGVNVVHVESRATCCKRSSARCRWTSRSSPPRSPTGASPMPTTHKIKKKAGQATPEFSLTENPDILATVAHRKSQRPRLVIGFAAETENVAANAKAKLARKGCDWILANDVSPQTGIMGGDRNTIQLVTARGIEPWPPQSKEDVAKMLVERIAAELPR